MSSLNKTNLYLASSAKVQQFKGSWFVTMAYITGILGHIFMTPYK